MTTERERKVLMYVLYYMERLRVDECATFNFDITDDCLDQGKRVIDDGFIPTEDEFAAAVCGFKMEGELELTDLGKRVLREFKRGKQP